MDMLAKSVCPKCGQIYDSSLGKCPLCGAVSNDMVEQPAAPARRRGGRYLSPEDKKALRKEEEAFLREEEGRYRRMKRRGESDAPDEADDGRVPAGFIVASVLVLLIALVIGGSFLLWKADILEIGIYDRLSGKTETVTTEATLAAQTPTLSTTAAPIETAEETVTTAETEETQPPVDLPDYDTDIVILVNEDNPIPDTYEVGDLVTLGSGAKIDRRCEDDLQAMVDDCRAAQHYPKVCEGYDASASDKSEFRTGFAIDIFPDNDQTRDVDTQLESETLQWLWEHSWEYGFIIRYPEGRMDDTGHSFEPWHFRYVGKDVAEYMHNNDMVLEQFAALLP